ncbi:MAG TPA: hypothetical protein ACFE0H_05545 [Elainellaceae cyanobacterium]
MNHQHQKLRHSATQQFIEALSQLEKRLSASQKDASEGKHSSSEQPLDNNRADLDQLETHSLDSDFKVDSLEDAVADIEQYIQSQDLCP